MSKSAFSVFYYLVGNGPTLLLCAKPGCKAENGEDSCENFFTKRKSLSDLKSSRG